MTTKQKEIITADQAPKPIGPYSVAVRAGGWIFASGTVGIDANTGEFVPGGIESQTRKALENLENILASAGSSLDSVVKTTVFLQDMGEFGEMNAVYAEFFDKDPPARSTVEVAALPKGAAVEIEVIAMVVDNKV
ncbi:MAG: hypothetical protein GTO18_21580 [Anaerolineales bacterium]|nr:hypothetical protein [Anaerolineales bacterium]